MLRSYDEMRKIDIRPYCEVRKEGKEEIPYLNWAKCIDLLHENGAEKAFFEPVPGQNGSSLIHSGIAFKDKYDTDNRAYETRIRVTIDDLVWEYQGPIMNGANPVKDNSMSQQRLWNCQCRLFVKAVAIRTGLGFDLWIKSEEQEGKVQKETDIQHDIMKVRDRVLQELTTLNKRGLSKGEIAEKLGLTEDEIEMKFKMYSSLAVMEKNILGLLNDCGQR